MRILLTLIQAIFVVMLGVLDFPPQTTFRWVLVIIAAVGFIVTTGIKEHGTTRREEGLTRQIFEGTRREEELSQQLKEMGGHLEEIRDSLFRSVGREVMEAPKEVSPAPAPAPSAEIQIEVPRDGSGVPWRTYVEGTVTDPSANVWVIVHPMELSAYWVQPPVAVKEDGTWKVCIYIGEPGDVHVGKLFEIMVIANPIARLRQGEVFSSWPGAQWESRVVEVTRE